MTTEHYIVFIGANRPLADELSELEKRIELSKVVAPAVRRKQVGITQAAVSLASEKLHKQLASEGHAAQSARLYLWMYDPADEDQLDLVWSAFGHASWIETIPSCYRDKKRPTRLYVEERIREVRQLLHIVSEYTYARRRSSPLTLPLRNFSSEVAANLKSYWYNDLDLEKLTSTIKKLMNRHAQSYNRPKRGYIDDNHLVFCPAKNSDCHGLAHPTGTEPKAFFCGRFRFGVSLFPGFHFEVSARNGPTIRSDLYTALGDRRVMSSENRRYINIFPNDFLRPEK